LRAWLKWQNAWLTSMKTWVQNPTTTHTKRFQPELMEKKFKTCFLRHNLQYNSPFHAYSFMRYERHVDCVSTACCPLSLASFTKHSAWDSSMWTD
jgi:hypothetical protein